MAESPEGFQQNLCQCRAVKGKALCCPYCDLPAGYIKGGCLVIESRHHGEKHVTTLTLEELETLLK